MQPLFLGVVMTRSYDEFILDCKHFTGISDSLRDGWRLKQVDGIVYIAKTQIVQQNSDNTCISCDYHVIHHVSYQVPVLYFTACYNTGQVVPVDKIWSVLVSMDGITDKWSMISQTDHPIYSFPCYYVHPCHTATLMKNHSKTSNYLLTYITSVSPLVGLHVSIDYVQN